MALEKVGVQFVTDGFNKFMGEIADAQKAIVEMGKSITQNKIEALAVLGNTAKEVSGNYAKALRSANSANRSYTDSSNDMARQINKTMSNIKSLGNALSDVAKREEKNSISLKRAFANVWEGVPSAAALGGTIGGLLSGGNPVGAAFGSMAFAIAKATDNVIEAVGTFFKDVGRSILTFFPELIRDITNVGVKIVNAIGGIIKSILSLAGNVGKAILSVFGMRGDIGDSLLASMIKFEILKQSIRKVIEVIKTLGKSAIEAAINLQTLNVRLDNLIASQERGINETLNYAESIKIASGKSEELLNWIQRLALETPIDTNAISNTISLSLAMGWGVDSAKELTEAIVNYTAGAGLSNDIMERIIYNFAQMRNAGKVTGTELRDLARGAFLPVNEILNIAAKNLGIAADSMEEFREAAANGAIDIGAFFDATIEYVNTAFPDAARRMNYTFAAVQDNLKDIFETVVGWNILNPIIENLAKTAQDFLAIFQRPDVIMFTKVLGKSLLEVVEGFKSALSAIFNSLKSVFRAIFPEVEQPINRLRGELGRMYEELEFGRFEKIIIFFVKLAGAIEHVGTKIAQAITDKIVPKAEEMGDKLDGTFKEISEDAFSWGAKMVVNFAAGVARGIATALTWAMNSISSFLSFWLAPGSPPNVAPDIDLWGMQTIAEWLHGFTMADFDVIKSLGDNLRGSLESLFYLGAMSEDAVLPTFRDIYAELIAAMDDFNETGVMAESIFERLSNIGGVYGDELASLLDLQLELAYGVERVAAAQEAYNAAVEATKISTATTNRMIREYNAMLRAGASEQSLRDKLLAVQASQIQLALDREQEQAAQEELDAAEEALKPLEEAVALQEELIAQLIELAKLQKEIADANEEAGGGAGSGADDNENIFDPLLGWGTGAGDPIEWQALFDHFKQIALNELSTLWDDLAVIWGDPFAPVKTAWNNLMHHFELTWNEVASVFDFGTFEDIFGTTYDPYANLPSQVPSWVQDYDPFRGDAPTGTSRLASLLETIQTILQTISDKFEDIDWESLTDKAVDIISDIWGALQKIDFVAVADTINTIATWFSENMTPTDAAITLGATVIGGPGAGATVGGALTLRARIIELIEDEIRKINGDLAATPTDAGLLDTLANRIFGADGILDTFFDTIFTSIGLNPPIGTGGTDTSSIFDTIIQNAMTALGIPPGGEGESSIFSALGRNIIDSFISGAGAAVLDIPAKIVSWVQDNIIAPFTGELQVSSPSVVFFNIGVDTIQGFIDGAISLLTNIWTTYFVEPFNIFLTSVLNFFGIGKEGKTAGTGSVFGKIGTNVIQGFIDGAISLLTGIWENVFRTPFQNLITSVRGFLGLDGEGDTNKFFSIGEDIIDGLVGGIESMINDVRTAINSIASSIPSWVQDILGMESPSKVMFDLGVDTMDGLINGIESKEKDIENAVSDIADSISYVMDDKFKMASPSKVFSDMGENMMAGMEQGIIKAGASVNRAIDNTLGKTMRQGKLTMPITMSAMPVNAGNSVTFGDVYVNDRIDLATLKACVQQMILER